MTALAIVVGAVGVALIWAGITDHDPLKEVAAVLTGTRKLPAAHKVAT